MGEEPRIGQAVTVERHRDALRRVPNAVREGVVTDVRDDGMHRHFTVEFSESWRVEYPLSRWWDTVQPKMCSVCDSDSHDAWVHE